MDEAILKNTSPLKKRIGTIRLLAAVAPLLGSPWNSDGYDCHFSVHHPFWYR